ncbi:MAG: GAF domain-containing protein [Bacteroidota bacterium]
MNRDYATAVSQIKGVTAGEGDLIANLSNVSAILKELDGFFWVGFYLVKDNELVVGPYQGPVACSRIARGKGVCGTSWEERRAIVVNNVQDFPGHIACSPDSQSEIVVPIFDKNKNVAMILDVDSSSLNAFDQDDQKALEEVGKIITKLI